MNGAERIAAERQRQIDEEGYTPQHDAEHGNGALAYAAACYAAPDRIYLVSRNSDDKSGQIAWWEPWPHDWPRAQQASTSATRIRDLEKAGALIAAEIDRLLAKGEA